MKGDAKGFFIQRRSVALSVFQPTADSDTHQMSDSCFVELGGLQESDEAVDDHLLSAGDALLRRSGLAELS